MASLDQSKFQIMREETADLSKSMNQVYNSIIFSCQKRCLTSFITNKVSKDEGVCLQRCANENMFLDNFLTEADSAS